MVRLSTARYRVWEHMSRFENIYFPNHGTAMVLRTLLVLPGSRIVRAMMSIRNQQSRQSIVCREHNVMIPIHISWH